MTNIPVKEKEITDEQVLAAFDLTYPGLENVGAAVREKNYDMAKRELVSYFHTRTNVSFIFDYRGIPLKPVDQNADQNFFQAANGLTTDFKEFMDCAGSNIMNHIYMLPGGRGKSVDLGSRFETAPHFNYLTDEGKCSRTPLNMFTRGQWMEYLFVLYQNTGDQKVAEKFTELLQYFFKDYALIIEDTSADANRFQYTEDRTVMSVGWLAVTYMELLYTELAYAVDYKATFEIIKHMWFIGIQFTRFKEDTYRPHNHHLWERGLMPFILGTLFPEIPDFKAMKTRGAEQICLHVKDDFNAHGGYNEYSIAYWSGAALGEMLYRGMYLARLNKETLLDREAVDRIDKTFRALAQMVPPGEHYPPIGDGKGAVTDQVLAMGEKMAANEWCSELLQYRTGNRPEPPSIPLHYSDDTVGFTCGRTDFGRYATYFLMATKVDCGGSGHNHMDMLSLTLIVRGEEFIGEPYTGTLYPRVRMGSRQRGYLYNMTSHNTVLVHGKPIAEDEMYARQWNLFRPDTPVHTFSVYPEGMYAEASHSGYSYCRHMRKLLFAGNGNMIVRDEIKPGSRMDKLHIQRWHLMADVICLKIEEHAVLLEKNGVKVLCVWNGIAEIILWKDEEVLCPEIYPSKEELGYNIDIRFKGIQSGDVEQRAATVDMALIDVTDKDMHDVSRVLDMLKMAKANINCETMLNQLKNII